MPYLCPSEYSLVLIPSLVYACNVINDLFLMQIARRFGIGQMTKTNAEF
jgi:hypothetical protein